MQPADNAPRPLDTLLVVEERLTVSKSVEETGAVRVRIESEQHDEHLTLEHIDDTVEVERVSVDRPVDARREPWVEGEVLVVPVYREVTVVERRLVLVEELHVRRRSTRSVVQEVIPLVRQRAVVERRSADGSWAEDSVPVDPPTQSGEKR